MRPITPSMMQRVKAQTWTSRFDGPPLRCLHPSGPAKVVRQLNSRTHVSRSRASPRRKALRIQMDCFRVLAHTPGTFEGISKQ